MSVETATELKILIEILAMAYKCGYNTHSDLYQVVEKFMQEHYPLTEKKEN